MIEGFSNRYIDDLKGLLDRFPHDVFQRIFEVLLDAYKNDRHIFVMGNGGSGSTASHFVCDINKGSCAGLEKRFKMICLNDNTPSILAYANDQSYEDIFVEQLKNFLKTGDVVIGISGSGNSVNVLKAIEYAKGRGAITIGLSGFDGGRLSRLADISLVAEINDMQKSEDLHMIVVHILMQSLSKAVGCS
ncbi:MAG: SIS domain-containing protein [Thermodesulfovibrionia bacterium]